MNSGYSLLDLAKQEVETFQNNHVAWMECLITCQCTKSIMEVGYKILVRQNRVTPIEKMSQSDKEVLWEQTKEFSKGRLNKEEMIRVARGLVALEYFLT